MLVADHPSPVADERLAFAIVADLDAAGVRLLELASPRLAPAGYATSYAEAAAFLDDRTVRVIVLGEISHPGAGDAEAAYVREAKDRRPDVGVVALRSALDPAHVRGVLAAGVDGYCLATTAGRDLAQVFEAVATGATWLDPEPARVAFSRPRLRPASAGPRLSPREREILRLLAQGFSNEEIADRLSCAPATVKTHLLHLFRKLGVRDRVSAAVWALRNDAA